MYSLVGSCVSWLHANLQVLSLCHCSILNQFPLKKNDLKKRRKSTGKKLRWYTWAYKFYPCGFFFLVLRKPQKIHPSFCVHMNGKVKQSSEKAKKAKKIRSLRFYQWQKIHIVFWWILFQSVHQLVLGDDRCFNELLH